MTGRRLRPSRTAPAPSLRDWSGRRRTGRATRWWAVRDCCGPARWTRIRRPTGRRPTAYVMRCAT